MKNIPNFKNEIEESEFWKKNDSVEYLDWNLSNEVVFSNLKPTLKSISLRLPEIMLTRLKQEANKLDIPYQSLLKKILNEGLNNRLHQI